MERNVLTSSLLTEDGLTVTIESGEALGNVKSGGNTAQITVYQAFRLTIFTRDFTGRIRLRGTI